MKKSFSLLMPAHRAYAPDQALRPYIIRLESASGQFFQKGLFSPVIFFEKTFGKLISACLSLQPLRQRGANSEKEFENKFTKIFADSKCWLTFASAFKRGAKQTTIKASKEVKILRDWMIFRDDSGVAKKFIDTVG